MAGGPQRAAEKRGGGSSSRLAREVLDGLVASGTLRPVIRDRLVAFECYELPGTIRLGVPDLDRFAPLLAERTRQHECSAVGQALLELAATEERDTWLITESRVTVVAAPGNGHDLAVSADYEARQAKVSSNPGLPAADDVAWATVDGGSAMPLERGGLLPMSRGSGRVRATLLQHEGEVLLCAAGPTELVGADGAVARHPSRTWIPLESTVEFSVRAPRLRPWVRGITGSVRVRERPSEPGLVRIVSATESRTWDPDRTPRQRIDCGATTFLLSASGVETVDVEHTDSRPCAVLWLDGARLEVRPGEVVPMQLGTLSGLEASDGDRLSVEPPKMCRPFVAEVVPGSRALAQEAGGLFGFSAAFATVLQDGVVVDPAGPRSIVLAAGAGSGLQVAVDTSPGCKVSPLSGPLKLDHRVLQPGEWGYAADGVVIGGQTGLRVDAAGRVRLLLDQPVPVAYLSHDRPSWSPQKGCRLRMVVDGWDLLLAAGSCVTGGRTLGPGRHRLAAAEDRTIELAGGLFRVVTSTPGARQER